METMLGVRKMKAIVQTEYGAADVLKLAEVDRPIVSANGVLVRVRATAVHAGDWHLMRGTPFLVRLIYGGLRKPQINILGTDVAGEVEAVGKDVTQFRAGDAVFGDLSASGFGGFAEYVCVPERALVLKPHNLTFTEAATVPVSALAALQGLRVAGKLQSGQKVLINGASGGVGSFAIQIAKTFGVEVTARCSPSNADLVRSLGADRIVDRTESIASLTKGYYDTIVDAAAYASVFDYLPALTPTGTYVCIGGSTVRLFQAMFVSLWSQQVKFLASEPNQADLGVLKDLIEAGKIRPCIDRTYSLSEVPVAIEDLEQRRVRGKIAISV